MCGHSYSRLYSCCNPNPFKFTTHWLEIPTS